MRITGNLLLRVVGVRRSEIEGRLLTSFSYKYLLLHMYLSIFSTASRYSITSIFLINILNMYL